MATLSHDDVRHIAQLARLRLRDAEVEKFSRELSSILEYVDQLRKVDTGGVEATAQVTGQTNGFRDDTARTQDVDPAALLALSPLPVIERQIETPSAHG